MYQINVAKGYSHVNGHTRDLTTIVYSIQDAKSGFTLGYM